MDLILLVDIIIAELGCFQIWRSSGKLKGGVGRMSKVGEEALMGRRSAQECGMVELVEMVSH